MFKNIITVLVCFTFTLASDKHNPEVYESIEEPLPDIIRKARQYGDKYKPQIFIYDKAMQPDLQRWRYHQQQQIDSKNMEQIQMHVVPPSIHDSRQQQHKDKDQTVSEAKESSVSRTLPGWNIIHPKFVNERWNDFSPRELIRMQDQYGRKQLKRTPIFKTKNENNRTADSNSTETNGRKSIYMVKEYDLETAASEVRQVRSPIDKQDELNLILPSALAHTVFIPATISKENIKAPSPPLLDDLNRTPKDMDALNSLLGNTPAAQIHGLKQLLNSQSMQVAPLTNSHINGTSLINDQNFDTQLISQSIIIPTDNDNSIRSPEIQNILQAGGQSLEQMQLQLDDLSRKEGERAMAEAHQKAIEYVRSQQEAIQRAEAERRQINIAAIKAHNLHLPESLPESLSLTGSLQNTSVLQVTGNSEQPSENLIFEQNNHQELSIRDSDLQAQTYLAHASQHSTLPNVEVVANHLSAPTASNNILTYPEVNNNGLSGVNNPHTLNENVEHAEQQAEAYSQPVSIVQNAYDNSKNIQVSFQHNVSSNINSKYYLLNSFLKLSVHKITHNRVKRQNLADTSEPVESTEYYYNENNAENETTTEANGSSETFENLPTPEKFIFSEDSYYDDSGYDESNSDNFDDDTEIKPPFRSLDRRYSRFRYHSPKSHHHKHIYIKKPDIAVGGNNFDTISKIIPTKHNGSPTVILINNNNGNANHNGKDAHKHKHRNIKNRPTFRKRNYSKIDRKIRKALLNLRKFHARHFRK